LEDRTGKTSVYFGGQPSEEEDQFFYRSLRPVGDINGDGYADAAEIDIENNQVRLFLGSPSGYQDSGVTRSLDLTFEIDPFVSISGFTDLDGDGLDDVLIGKTIGSPEFEVLYGASEVSGVETRRYEVEGEFFSESAYNTATLGGSGRAVRLFGASGDPKSARIYSFDAGRSLSTDQSFAAEELQDGGNSYELSLVDVNGSGTREIVAASFDTTYAFPGSAGSGGVEYETTPTGLASGRAIPAGDLDGDGRHDFYRTRSGDNDGSSPFISYGPSDLTGGLTSDTEIPTDPGTELDFRTLPAGSLGDLTGDGRTDLILHIRDDTDDERGRRFLNVSAGREIETSTDIRVPTGYQVDQITQTNELGDINGDGIEDFAVVRSTLDQIEVYYGGESIPETPARTLQVASDTLEPASISTGDVTGDGNPDLVVGYSRGERVDVYGGGGPLGPNPDRSITASEAGVSVLRQPEVVGDIDGDGTEDVLASNKGEFGPGDVPERLFLFFGGTPLPSQPDRTIEYSDSSGEHVLASIGDVNGGGIPDFAVGRPELNSSGGGAEGQVDIYFGENSGSFGEPDVTLNPETSTQDIRRFGGAIASGDFNGDGIADIAVRPAEVDPSGPTDAVEVSIYLGGASLNDVPDQRLSLPAATLTPSTPLSERGSVDENDDGLADREIRGAMDAVPVSGEADGLLLASGDGSAVNALLYRPTLSSGPTSVLEAPNQDADLGGEAREIAIGDFTGDGRPGAVLVQQEENNDASLSSRFYRFELGEFPVSSASADVSSDGTVDLGETGVDLRFDGVTGSGSVIVQRFESEPSGTDGIEKPAVSSVRFTAGAEAGLDFDSVEVQLAVSAAGGIGDPSDVTIYRRPEVGSGSFDSLSTTVGTAGTPGNVSDDTLYATAESLSEFALASGEALSYPEEVTVDTTRSFGDASGPGDYRLVALPGQVNRPIGETLDGDAGAEWQVYWDDGSSFVKYDESETFRLRAGNGFWVTSTQDWTVSETVQTVALSENQSTTVPLNGESEWTIVSNPFDRDVSWSEVLSESGLNVPLWRYDASEGFVQADVMRSASTGTAYYVFNEAGIGQLTIPYRASSGSKAVSKAQEDSQGFSISARPASGEGPPSTVRVGLGEKETHAAPPGRFEPASLRLTPPSSDRALMAARRPAKDGGDGGGEGQTFALRLTIRVEGPVEIEAEDLGKSGSESAALLRPETGESYDLRRQETVTIGPEGKTVELKVAVGSGQYVEERADQVVPREVSLTSYPNPTGGQATVEYALPEARKVTLEVYDVLGRRVATLAEGKRQAGRHEASLQAGDLPSGVYFGRLEAGGETRTQKITVVR
jgi:hypothetical protein